MGQLVPLIAGDAGDRHVKIPGRGGQKDLLGIGIDGHDNIDVAPAVGRDRAGYVNPADVYVKWFFYVGIFLFNRCLDPVLIEDLHLLFVIFDIFFNDAVKGFVIDGRLHLSGQQAVCQVGNGVEFFQLQFPASHFFHVFQHPCIIFLIHAGLTAKPVICRVQDAFRRIVCLDYNDHVVGLVGSSAHLFHGFLDTQECEDPDRQPDADQKADDDAQVSDSVPDVLQEKCNGKEQEQSGSHQRQIQVWHHAAVPYQDQQGS